MSPAMTTIGTIDVVKLDGTAPDKLTSGVGNHLSPMWSPDGKDNKQITN